MSGYGFKKHSLLKDKILPGLVMALALGVILGGSWLVKSLPKGQKTAAAKLALPRKHTVVLIDQTDTLSAHCATQLELYLKDLPESMEPGEMVSLFAVDANSDITVSPLLSEVNPGSNVNEWLENYELKRQLFDKEFVKPITAIAGEVKSRPDSKTSPIIETINRIATWHKFSDKVSVRRMVIYSDMLQNSRHCSDYTHSKAVHPASLGCPDLEPLWGVDVDLRYILRRGKSHLQTDAHRKNWIRRLRSAGAKVKLTPIL